MKACTARLKSCPFKARNTATLTLLWHKIGAGKSVQTGISRVKHNARPRSCALIVLLCALGVTALAQSVAGKLQEEFAKFCEEAVAANRKDLAEGVSKSLNDGNLREAVKLLQTASQQEASLSTAQPLMRTLEQASPEDVFRQGHFVQDSSGRLHLVSLSSAEQVHIRALDEIQVSWWRKTFVTRDAKKFVQEVAYGTQHSDQLIDACLKGSACSVEQKLKIGLFLSVPQSQRLFLIGAGADAPFTQAYIDARQKLGDQVFHYRNCLTPAGELCSSDLLGALIAKSSDFLLADSAKAEVSQYVLPEVAAVQRLQQGQGLMIMIPIEDLKAAAEAAKYATTRAVTAEVYTLSQQ